MITEALKELSVRAGQGGFRVAVKIIYDRQNLKHVSLNFLTIEMALCCLTISSL
jgi:hypothetical protein